MSPHICLTLLAISIFHGGFAVVIGKIPSYALKYSRMRLVATCSKDEENAAALHRIISQAN